MFFRPKKKTSSHFEVSRVFSRKDFCRNNFKTFFRCQRSDQAIDHEQLKQLYELKSCFSTNWFFPTILMIELLYQNHGVFPAGACHYMSIIWQSCSIFTKLCSNYIFCSLMRPPLKKLWLLCVGCVGSQFPVIKLATFLSFLRFLPTLASTGI